MTDAEIKELLVMFTWIYLIILPLCAALAMSLMLISEYRRNKRKNK